MIYVEFGLFLIVGIILSSLITYTLEERNQENIKFELRSVMMEKTKIEYKFKKVKSEKSELELEKSSLLNILESEGYSKAVKYNPYLKKYEQCWCKE